MLDQEALPNRFMDVPIVFHLEDPAGTLLASLLIRASYFFIPSGPAQHCLPNPDFFVHQPAEKQTGKDVGRDEHVEDIIPACG